MPPRQWDPASGQSLCRVLGTSEPTGAQPNPPCAPDPQCGFRMVDLDVGTQKSELLPAGQRPGEAPTKDQDVIRAGVEAPQTIAFDKAEGEPRQIGRAHV